jgi:hypothetical protein
MVKPLSLEGMRFGKLVVSERAFSPSPGTRWLCVCDCGQTTVVSGPVLTRGTTKSCGCLRREVSRRLGSASRTHGHGRNGGSPTHRTWRGMVKRCADPEDRDWPRYGGRGIRVCARWASAFENFLADMGVRPEGMTLERRDNDKDYDPDNCFWASRKRQANNRSSNIRATINGETLTVAQWAARLRLRPGLVYKRLQRGWPIEEALTPPRT